MIGRFFFSSSNEVQYSLLCLLKHFYVYRWFFFLQWRYIICWSGGRIRLHLIRPPPQYWLPVPVYNLGVPVASRYWRCVVNFFSSLILDATKTDGNIVVNLGFLVNSGAWMGIQTRSVFSNVEYRYLYSKSSWLKIREKTWRTVKYSPQNFATYFCWLPV